MASTSSFVSPLSLTAPSVALEAKRQHEKQHDVEPEKVSLISAEKLSDIVEIAEKEGKEGLDKLIADGVLIHESCAEGYTALSLAFHRKKLNAVKALLNLKLAMKADPCWVNPITGNNLVHIAAGVGFVEGIHLLFELDKELKFCKFNELLTAPNAAGHTPLGLAIKYKQTGSLQTLIKYKVDVNSPCFKENPPVEKEHIPIERAILCDFPEAIPLLAKAGAKIDQLDVQDVVDNNPFLRMATENQNIECMRALIHCGAPVDSESWKPLLFYAAEKGFVEGVELLLESGATADAILQPINDNVLMSTLSYHIPPNIKLKIAQLLIKFGADVSYIKPSLFAAGIPETPIHNAIRSNFLPGIQLLACYGANLDTLPLYLTGDLKTRAYLLICENLVPCFEVKVLKELEETILKQYHEKISQIPDLTIDGQRKILDETIENVINDGLKSNFLKPTLSDSVPPETTKELLIEVLKQFLHHIYIDLNLELKSTVLKEEPVSPTPTFDDVEDFTEIAPKDLVAIFVKNPKKLLNVLNTIDKNKKRQMLLDAIVQAFYLIDREPSLARKLSIDKEQLYSFVELCVNQGADLSSKLYGDTFLHRIVHILICSNVDLIDEKLFNLLTTKELINLHNDDGESALNKAVYFADLFRNQDYDSNPQSQRMSRAAAIQRAVDVFFILLKLGADCKNERWVAGNTPLQHAAYTSVEPIMEAFIELGHDFRTPTADDTEIINLIIKPLLPEWRSETKLRSLIASGAEVKMLDHFIQALALNWPEIIPLLFVKLENPRVTFGDNKTIFDVVENDPHQTEILTVCEQIKGQIDNLSPKVFNLLEVRIRTQYYLRKKGLPPTKADALGLLDRQLLRGIVDQEIEQALKEKLLRELDTIHPVFPDVVPTTFASKMLGVVFEQASYQALMRDKNADNELIVSYKKGKQFCSDLETVDELRVLPINVLSIISEYSIERANINDSDAMPEFSFCINGRAVSPFSLDENSVYGEPKTLAAIAVLHYFYMQKAGYPTRAIPKTISFPFTNTKDLALSAEECHALAETHKWARDFQQDQPKTEAPKKPSAASQGDSKQSLEERFRLAQATATIDAVTATAMLQESLGSSAASAAPHGSSASPTPMLPLFGLHDGLPGSDFFAGLLNDLSADDLGDEPASGTTEEDPEDRSGLGFPDRT